MNIKNILTISILALLPGALFASSGFVVIASTQSEFETGSIVAASQSILLENNQTLKLLSSSGKLLGLIGPYNGLVESTGAKKDNNFLETLAKVVKSANSTDLTLATYRNNSLSEDPMRGDIWGVEIGKSGNFCVPDDAPVILWWPNSVQGVAVTITDTSHSNSVDVLWTSRRKETTWPTALPVLKNSNYTSKIELSRKISEFTLSRIPNELSSNIDRVVWMTKQKCEHQALRLLGKVINDNAGQ